MTDKVLEELFRPLSPEKMAAYQKELDQIDFDALLEPTVLPHGGGFPVMPYSPVWHPKPAPFYR